MKPALIDISAVMDRLDVKRKAVMRLVMAGQLIARRVGRQWRFDPADVEAFVVAAKFSPIVKVEHVVRPQRSRRTAALSAGADRYM